jgi:TIR domain
MSENNGLQGPEEDAVPAGEATLHADSVRDVFVSYASQDSELANAVVQALEQNGLSCWIAPRDVVPGDLYADGIIRAITGAKVFVLVLSRNAIASNHVGKEVERASSKRRPIVALRTDTTPLTSALEYFLSESQWIELQAGRTEAALPKIVDAVRRQRGVEAVNPSAIFESNKRAQGDAAGALAELDREETESLRFDDGWRILMYDALGRKSEADAALAKLEKTHANEDGYEIGRIYANRGDLKLSGGLIAHYKIMNTTCSGLKLTLY